MYELVSSVNMPMCFLMRGFIYGIENENIQNPAKKLAKGD